MRKLILSLLLIILVFATMAQSDPSTGHEFYFNYGCIDIPPRFPGGHARMQQVLANSMKYPREAERKWTEGTVRIGFAVDTFGRVVNVKIIKGICGDLDQEAVRLIGLLKHWIPGTVNGKKTLRYQVLPFIFKMDRRPTFKHHVETRKTIPDRVGSPFIYGK